MTTTAARQAAEEYALGITHGEIDRKFLAGWNAAIEKAAEVARTHVDRHVGSVRSEIAAAIRAERSE